MTRVVIGLLHRYPKDIDIIFGRRGYFFAFSSAITHEHCNYVNFYPDRVDITLIDYLDEDSITEDEKLEWKEFISKCTK